MSAIGSRTPGRALAPIFAAAEAKRARAVRFGDALFAWRSAAQMDGREAATKIGISLDTYGNAEARTVDPRVLGPALAMSFLRGTGLSAIALGFEDEQDPTAAVAPAAVGRVPAAVPPEPASSGALAAGTPAAGLMAVWHAVPGLVMAHIDGVTMQLDFARAEQLGQRMIDAARAGRAAEAAA